MKRLYLSPPHVGDEERQMLLEAFDSNWIAPLGPHVDAFEREFAGKVGVPHAVALSSGTAALHIALLMLGVGPGDEVVTSTLTFVATANAIAYTGARPVFIDCSPDTWNMDPALLEEELNERARRNRVPKAVLVVDALGRPADWDPITALCKRHDIPIIEDAAESLGATYQGNAVGSFGAFAAFSFNGNKIITTSGGGMLACHSEETAERVRFLATQARDPAPHYEHSVVGYNYRLSNLLAALGRAQLAKLDDRVAARRRNNAWYREALAGVPGIDFMREAPYGRSTFWLTCITIDPSEFGACRLAVQRHLENANIEARTVWKPMHLQPVYEKCAVRGGAVSQGIFERGLCLPSGSDLTEIDKRRVVDGLLSTPR